MFAIKKCFWRVWMSLMFCFVVPSQINGQSAIDLRFSEVLVYNDSLNVDNFGKHSSWIEIFNSSYNTVDIGGCYITNDLSNPTKYWIPTGDPSTRLQSRCYMVFWADNKPSRGILHLNFTITESDTLALFDANGKTLIDKLIIPSPQYSNMSYGLILDENEIGEEVAVWKYLDKITPASANDHTRKASSGERFVKMDPTGVGMAAIAMMVVFTSLALLYFVFKSTGNYFTRAAAKKSASTADFGDATVKSVDLSGEVSAAISLSLYMYSSNLHDQENTVLTIKKVARTYSPWSSKIYSLRKYPR
jgi:hypothetical protein